MSQNETSTCRFCGEPLHYIFADLGQSPLANSYVPFERLNQMEPFFPLQAYVCEHCFLVQLEEFETPQNIFGDYAYFSSYSDTLLDHSRRYTEMITNRFNLGKSNLVTEIASNDGYLLQYFLLRNIPVLGIEPAENVAKAAVEKGIPTIVKFFGRNLASELRKEKREADLIIGNNVLAHVPDLNDFVVGLKILLNEGGIITIEFPHVLNLIQLNQFDTIYHEHFSYFSFLTVEKIFLEHGLVLFDVDEIPTHGGSLRIYGRHWEDETKLVSEKIYELKQREIEAGLCDLKTYTTFNEIVKATKRNILQFFLEAKNKGKHVAGYGAPAKSVTLLNYCGIKTDLIDYTVDRSPHKQKRYLPGTRIPIYPPEKIRETKPDYLFLLPWNLKDEIIEQMSFIRDWGGKFVVPIPDVRIIE